MKYLLVFAVSMALLNSAIAQNAVTIDVEKLPKPESLLPETSADVAFKALITSDHNNPNTIVAEGKTSGNVVNFGYHSFFRGMYNAYAQHRPFTLSPDMIWLLISQGFAAHVNNNAESLRSLFVNFKGKASLVVNANGISLNNPDSPWEQLFPQFSTQIDEYVGPQFSSTLTADFSTTTPVSKVASQITMMNAVKSYFTYTSFMMGCGIPKTMLEGTPGDWQQVLDKTEALRKYQLGWWVDEMEPVLKSLIAESKGKNDTAFWQSAFKYHSGKKCGTPTTVDGWIVKFFPYNKLGYRNNLDSLSVNAALPDEIVKVDLDFIEGDGAGNFKSTPLELWAGFTGLRQNEDDFGLKPQIGWMIKRKDDSFDDATIVDLKKRAASTSMLSGIHLTGNKVPKELLQIGPIRNLEIDFTGDVNIPDEMSLLHIDRFKIFGKIDHSGIERLKKLMPYTQLIINDIDVNGSQPNNGGLSGAKN